MTRMLNILVACEESQTVCKAFRALGHRAFSCDLQDCSGGHPEWHVNGDCLPLLDGDCEFTTCDGTAHRQQGEWDLLVCHPPCTYMTLAGARWMYPNGVLSEERLALAMDGKRFFMQCLSAKCKHVAVENPKPMPVVELPTPTQSVQPYQFGEPYSKLTMLWLRGLPALQPTEVLQEHEPWLSNKYWIKKHGNNKRWAFQSAKVRSKTFDGIARAMAEQWSKYIINSK